MWTLRINLTGVICYGPIPDAGDVHDIWALMASRPGHIPRILFSCNDQGTECDANRTRDISGLTAWIEIDGQEPLSGRFDVDSSVRNHIVRMSKLNGQAQNTHPDFVDDSIISNSIMRERISSRMILRAGEAESVAQSGRLSTLGVDECVEWVFRHGDEELDRRALAEFLRYEIDIDDDLAAHLVFRPLATSDSLTLAPIPLSPDQSGMAEVWMANDPVDVHHQQTDVTKPLYHFASLYQLFPISRGPQPIPQGEFVCPKVPGLGPVICPGSRFG